MAGTATSQSVNLDTTVERLPVNDSRIDGFLGEQADNINGLIDAVLSSDPVVKTKFKGYEEKIKEAFAKPERSDPRVQSAIVGALKNDAPQVNWSFLSDNKQLAQLPHHEGGFGSIRAAGLLSDRRRQMIGNANQPASPEADQKMPAVAKSSIDNGVRELAAAEIPAKGPVSKPPPPNPLESGARRQLGMTFDPSKDDGTPIYADRDLTVNNTPAPHESAVLPPEQPDARIEPVSQVAPVKAEAQDGGAAEVLPAGKTELSGQKIVGQEQIVSETIQSPKQRMKELTLRSNQTRDRRNGITAAHLAGLEAAAAGLRNSNPNVQEKTSANKEEILEQAA